MDDMMLIGEVTGVHGIRGEMKIRPLTDDAGRYYELDRVFLVKGNRNREYEIELVRIHKGNVLLTLEGINDRDQAEKLRGALVEIPKEEAVSLSEDEFFITDLIGLDVEDSDGHVIGCIMNILQTTGSIDTVVIKMPEKTIYVPMRKVYFTQIDVEGHKVIATIPEELMTL